MKDTSKVLRNEKEYILYAFGGYDGDSECKCLPGV